MTAIIGVRFNNGVVFYTDAACYDQAGVVGQFRQKADISIHLPAIIATRGSARAGEVLKFLMSNLNTFDELVIQLPGLMSEASVNGLLAGEPINLMAITGGFSGERQKWELYEMLISGESITQLDEGSLKLRPVESVQITPRPSDDALGDLGLLDAGVLRLRGNDDGEFVRVMEAARRTECHLHPSSELKGCIVGGFVQKTVLTQNEAWTSIIHHWPDRIGEMIDPWRDDSAQVP